MPRSRTILSLDSETTGLDLRFGAKPYLVTFCNEAGENIWFEWEVNPLTREPLVVYDDLIQIQKLINSADELVLQNPKFDHQALQTVFLGRLEWDWSKVRDTLIAGHLLASNQPHDLTTMSLVYMGINVQPYEDRMKVACNEARRWVRTNKPEWRLAQKGLPEMPSAKDSVWKYDAWLPKLVAKEMNQPSWETITAEYANSDSAVTLPLYKKQEQLIRERGLWNIYLERLKILPVVCAMEERGITISKNRLEELQTEYVEESQRAGDFCVNIAKSLDYELTLPKSGNNGSLAKFVFGPLGLEPVKSSKKTGAPSLDRSTLEHYEATLPERSKQMRFVQALKGKRSRDTALSYMEGYQKFWRPLCTDIARRMRQKDDYWFRLHPSLNATGTDTLRFSSQSPNEQNISKKENFNLRYCFGPAPGREWWSLDAKNIELRLPAYEAREEEMIDLFEREDEPPYFGSYHMLIFDTLHPEKFAKHGMECKKVYASTWYQWTKNGNFAVQYGAQEYSGTADRTYHLPGAQRRIKERFRKITQLSDLAIKQADKCGYVETMPDRTVDSKRGYPLLCTRSKWGKVLPTVPLSYKIQGTACWVIGVRAMPKIQNYLNNLQDCHLVMNVHDEVVLDFPKVANKGNLPRIKQIKRMMESIGQDLVPPVPLRVGIEYHPDNWATGETLA